MLRDFISWLYLFDQWLFVSALFIGSVIFSKLSTHRTSRWGLLVRSGMACENGTMRHWQSASSTQKSATALIAQPRWLELNPKVQHPLAFWDHWQRVQSIYALTARRIATVNNRHRRLSYFVLNWFSGGFIANLLTFPELARLTEV